MKIVLFIMLFLVGCGGHDNGPPLIVDNIISPEILRWMQPSTFDDNSYMDIHKDVLRWDIYCSEYPDFTDNDIVASVVSPDNLAFDLSMLRVYGVKPGPLGSFVSVRCVGLDNATSGFMFPEEWGVK